MMDSETPTKIKDEFSFFMGGKREKRREKREKMSLAINQPFLDDTHYL
jgi:hypothetical protein